MFDDIVNMVMYNCLMIFVLMEVSAWLQMHLQCVRYYVCIYGVRKSCAHSALFVIWSMHLFSNHIWSGIPFHTIISIHPYLIECYCIQLSGTPSRLYLFKIDISILLKFEKLLTSAWTKHPSKICSKTISKYEPQLYAV